MGGAHPSMVGTDLLNYPEVDIGVIGEGEITIVELLNAIEAQGELDDIQGIVYRRHGQVIRNPQRELIANLDSLCFPHEYAPEILKDYNKYPKMAFKNIFAIRGCPYNCSFCSNKIMHRCKLRLHSAERVVEEMAVLVKDYKAREIHFWDDCFVSDEKRVYDICSLLGKNKLKIPWDCEATVNRVNLKLLKEMRRAGCFGISYGIESGSNERLKKINKGWSDKDKIRQAVDLTKKAGLRARAYFMFGFVGETAEEMEQTIQFSKELNLDFATFSLLVPLPGSEDYERAKNEGQFDAYYWKNKLLSEISFPLDPVYVPAGLTKETLLHIHRRACNEFYFRPRIMLRRLADIRSVSNLWGSLKGAFSLLQKKS